MGEFCEHGYHIRLIAQAEPETEVAAMTRAEAIARLQQFWTEG